MLGWSASELANEVELVATIKRYEVQVVSLVLIQNLDEYKNLLEQPALNSPAIRWLTQA